MTIIGIFLWGLTCQAFAEKSLNTNSPSDLTHANWVFSGMVTSESGDEYGYYFQMQRQDKHFQVTASIVNAQDREVLMFYKSEAQIKNSQDLKWQVGRAFLSFNPINESWIFGLKVKDQQGFNFKVDLLSQSQADESIKGLSQGLKLIVNQTGRINGHIQFGKQKKEEFVTSSNAWFRQVWLSSSSIKPLPLSSLFCRFNDGSGLYSFNLKTEEADEGAIAGLCDAKGNPSSLSQFIEINEHSPDHLWSIHIASPEMSFKLSDSIKSPELLAGFIAEGAKSGFCVLCKDELESKKQS